jgi:hypothetical protein
MRQAAVAVVLGLVSGAEARGQGFTNRPVPGLSQMDRHNPFSSRYVDMTPGGYARRAGFLGAGPVGFSIGYSGGLFCFDGYPGCGDCWPCGYGSAPYDCGYSLAAPIVVPQDPWFGLPPPGVFDLGGLAQPAPPALAAPADAGEALEPQVRESNAEARARAWRFLGFGDTHFLAQRFRDANPRYRSATEIAPDLVEAHFRHGQALLATGQFELAARAFKRGMALGPAWTEAEFSLAQLYGENRLAKTSHMERLALAAEQQPENADLLLLVAMQLYFDQQPQRAAPFFRRAATQLAGANLHLDGVLGQPGDPQPVAGF